MDVPNYGHFAIVENLIEETKKEIENVKLNESVEQLETIETKDTYEDKLIVSKVWLIVLFIFLIGYYISKKRRRKA